MKGLNDMTKQEMLEIKKFIKKHNPKIKASELTDEFLLEQIKFYRTMQLKKLLSK